MNVIIEPEEEFDVELIDCRYCEASYSILLGEDYLHEDAHYCPFCGEYIVRDM